MMRSAALGAVALGGVVMVASMAFTPSGHDFRKVVVGNISYQTFKLAATTPLANRNRLKAIVSGPDAADFSVDSSTGITGGTPLLHSSCLSLAWTNTGSCDYRIAFQPKSFGRKTAQLIVDETVTGETATANLTGEGVFGCLPIYVPCNYAGMYSGTLTVTTLDQTIGGAPSRKGRWAKTITVAIEKGVALCTGQVEEKEEEPTASSVTTGIISGPGLFAIEFQNSGIGIEYILKFDCPSADMTIVSKDLIAGTASTGHVRSEPAEWRHASLLADPQPATAIGVVTLAGTQTDPHPDDGSGSGVQGSSKMTWSLKRWP